MGYCQTCDNVPGLTNACNLCQGHTGLNKRQYSLKVQGLSLASDDLDPAGDALIRLKKAPAL
jgi:hypothetical protein